MKYNSSFIFLIVFYVSTLVPMEDPAKGHVESVDNLKIEECLAIINPQQAIINYQPQQIRLQNLLTLQGKETLYFNRLPVEMIKKISLYITIDFSRINSALHTLLNNKVKIASTIFYQDNSNQVDDHKLEIINKLRRMNSTYKQCILQCFMHELEFPTIHIGWLSELAELSYDQRLKDLYQALMFSPDTCSHD